MEKQSNNDRNNHTERYQKAMNMLEVMENSQFAQVMKKGLLINEINEKLSKIFPAQFQPFIRFGQITNQVLFIETANAMVRQGILFQEKALIQQIQGVYPEVQKLNIKINPEFKKA